MNDSTGGIEGIHGDVAFNRAIELSHNPDDPNAGKIPVEMGNGNDGYQLHYNTKTYNNLPWVESILANHIGGTMIPTVFIRVVGTIVLH